MGLSERENFLNNASLRGHEWIPAGVYINGSLWYRLREELEDICLRHPVLFPGFEKGKIDFDSFNTDPYERVDEWGCRWRYELGGLDGQVIEHPLENWDAFDEWKKTVPAAPPCTEDDLQGFETSKAEQRVATLGMGGHGFFFMRLYYLRGFENFMMDVATEEPRLDELIEIVASHWEAYELPRLAVKPDLLSCADDLGTQTASMLGPKYFRRYLLPTYQRLFLPARQAGAHVFMHHDGYIMDIAEEIVESGVSIVNPQDLANGIGAIKEAFKGRVCIHLDIDRQSVLPYGSPSDVHDLIKEEVLELGSPAGGLMFIVGLYNPTPAANVDALCSALEEYRTYWVGR